MTGAARRLAGAATGAGVARTSIRPMVTWIVGGGSELAGPGRGAPARLSGAGRRLAGSTTRTTG
jgi:hypothetical protein